MKSLIKNYINSLQKEQLNEFALKNNIILSDGELEFILKLLKENIDDILIDPDKYFNLLETNINTKSFVKIKELYIYYTKRYKGYLF